MTGDRQIIADVEEGRGYREGVYRPLVESELREAPDAPPFPSKGAGPAFLVCNEVPRVPRVRDLIGPSVIAAGMGLGAGEFLLWPNLIAANGYGILWLFWVGVLTQFVVIHEIERWTIATGESVFAAMARLGRAAFWAWFFLVATFVSTFWPGWASQSAGFTGQIVLDLTGVSLAWQPIAIGLLAITWVGLAASKIVYNALERFEIGLVLGFFPLLLVALLLVGIRPGDLWALFRGAASIGNAPPELLTGAQFPTLLVAVAYAGSGGPLLLMQSLWIRDKGFGMASYMGRIAGIRGRNEEVSRTGYVFDPAAHPTAMPRYLAWMRTSRHELLLTFVLLIILSVVITSLLVGATVGTGNAQLAGNLSQMVTLQAEALELAGGRWLKIAFLLGGALVLFSTQFAIVDSITRVAGIVFYERYGRYTRFWTLKRTFLIFLSILIAACMAIVIASWMGGEGLETLQPDFLVLIAGPFTITSMYLLTLVVGYVNARRLPRELGPSRWKRAGLVWAVVLWGWFTAETLSRAALSFTGAEPSIVETIAWEPMRVAFYSIWLASTAWFATILWLRRD